VKKFCRKLQPPEQRAPTLQTDRQTDDGRQTELRQQRPERNVVAFALKSDIDPSLARSYEVEIPTIMFYLST